MPRTKPAVRIHLSVADHDKTADVWADVQMRGMLVELWRKAGEKFAGKRDDKVPLKPTDRMEVAGVAEQDAADALVMQLCRSLRYGVRKHPNRWVVTIRNFSKKQGYGGKESDALLSEQVQQTSASESESESYSESKSDRTGTAPAARGSGKARKAKTSEPDPRAVAAWPEIRDAFAAHGRKLDERVGADRAALLAKRFDEGHTAADLVAAVHGYVAVHGGLEGDERFDPRKYFQPRTVFKAEGFSDRVDAGRDSARTPQVSVLHAFPNVRTGR